MRRIIGGILLTAAFFCGGTGFGADKTLYERLTGAKSKDDQAGVAVIRKVVDEFVGNVSKDKKINVFFAKAKPDDLKKKLTDQICEATGGPCKYQGADMKTAHSPDMIKKATGGKKSKVTDADFNALVADLTKALDKYKVKKKEKDELLGALAGMKGDIVQ